MSGHVVLILSVHISSTRSEELVVKESDIPRSVVLNFIQEHNLSPDLQPYLTQQIYFHLQKLMEEEINKQETSPTMLSSKGTSPTMLSPRETSSAMLSPRETSSAMLSPKVTSPTMLSPKVTIPTMLSPRETSSTMLSLKETSPTMLSPKETSPTVLSPKSSSLQGESYSNNGERLYYKGKIHQERSVLRNKHLKEKVEEQEKRSLTFRPKINKTSLNLVLNREPKKQKDSLSILRSEILTNEHTQCTFSPRINPKSKVLARRNEKPVDKFQQLFMEASERKKRQVIAEEEYFRQECSFRPSIKSSEQSLNLSHSVSQNQSLMLERLLHSKKHTEEQLQEERSKQNAQVDPATGKEFFKPEVGRAPKTSRNSQKLPVGEYLYSQRKSAPEINNKVNKQFTANNRSEKLLLNIKIQKYFDIFQTLGPDSDGNIHGNSIHKDNVDLDVLDAIDPLIEEMKKYDKPLNFEDFAESMENLIATLPLSQKSLFYTKRKKKEIEEESTSKTGIFDGKEMYERQIKQVKEIEERRKIEKEQRDLQEMNECSFKPTITEYTRTYAY